MRARYGDRGLHVLRLLRGDAMKNRTLTHEDKEHLKALSDLRKKVTAEVAGFVATLVLNNDAATLQWLRETVRSASYDYWQKRLATEVRR